VRQIILKVVGLSLALGAGEACAAGTTPGNALIEITSDRNSDHVIRDLSLLPPPANSDRPTPALASIVNGAEPTPIPELPTWAMMLLCLVGFGLAGFKNGRKNRLSPGIE
jgi:hypothetical protein